MTHWRSLVTDGREAKIFEALEDARYDWRTMQALERESGLSAPEIQGVLRQYQSLVRESRARDGKPIWTLQERYWKRPGLTQFMDFIAGTST